MSEGISEAQARKTLRDLADKGDEWHLQMLIKLAWGLIELVENKSQGCQGSFGVDGESYFFSLYKDKQKHDQMMDLVTQAAVSQANEENPQ